MLHPLFRVPKEFDVPSIGLPTAQFLAHQAQQDKVDGEHAALYLGSLGFLMAAALGIRESLARGNWLTTILAPLLGAAGGAIGGLLGCLVLQDVRTNIGKADLKHLVEAQFAVALPLGLAVGLGLGIRRGSLGGGMRASVAGLAAGVLAAIVYPVVVAVLMPATSTDVLLPEGAIPRLLWLCLLAGLIGLGIPFGMQQRPGEANGAALTGQ